MARSQIKADLSELMDKLIDWKKLLDRLKADIIDILKVDKDMLNNNNILFIQTSEKKYDLIYTNVVKKQIEALNDELAQICGLNLTREA